MATTQPSRDRSGPLRRLPGADFSTAEAIFEAAMSLLIPDDQTQRKAFESLMPYMYVLRNKGCSWSQLTKLLTDSGFILQPSTIRGYYSEMLATRQDICQERMNEQILLMAEVRKENKGVDVSSIAGRVTAIMEKRREAAASKIENLFAGPSATPVAQTSAAGSNNEAAKPLLVENKNSGLRPAQANVPSAEIVPPSVPSEDSSSFGLLNLKPVAKKAASKAPAFFSQDDSTPVIPDLQISKTASENKNSGLRPAPEFSSPESKSQNTTPPTSLRCLALKDGVEPLKKREINPPEIYLPGDLEHPKIPGLMLSLDERLYSAALEYADENDEVKLETLDEKRFRVLWKRPIPMTPTMTGDSFTKMDMNLFKKL